MLESGRDIYTRIYDYYFQCRESINVHTKEIYEINLNIAHRLVQYCSGEDLVYYNLKMKSSCVFAN